MRNKFMEFKQLDADVTELLIYGEITKVGMFERAIADELGQDLDVVSALTFKEALDAVGTNKLTVRINSPGGSVSEALSIYNLLSDFNGEVTTKVDGFAASAAAIIFMAGKERIVPNSGLLMIHNAWASGQGNASQFRKMADDLEKITQPSVDIYVEKTGQELELIKELMDAETWLTSSEALELRFATSEIKEPEREMDFQQNAMLSLVKENKELKQQLGEKKETKEVEQVEPKAVEPEIPNKWEVLLNKTKGEK